MPDFIPPTDAAFALWSANFESSIDTEFATFGLTTGQATAYTALDTAFQASFIAATTPVTRTPVTIADKDADRAAAVANARVLAKIINAFPGITNMQRVALGLTPQGAGPTPIPAPVTKPVVVVVGYNPLGHVLQLRDETTPVSRAKPPGVIAAQVWAKIGAPAPVQLSECALQGVYTKPFLELTYPGASAGLMAYYLTRWQTRTGLVGPLSDLAGATIPSV